uniref:Ig-like domain-containing protein n=1 Tax=Sphenodon punctatus TaxID=8508 RepID=A0A8D0GEY3_SPHPU
MAWALLLLTLLTYCSGFSSQNQLTQANPTMSTALGQTAQLSCTLRGVEFISGNHPSWYQQSAGKVPRLLIYESRQRASGVAERFSGETSVNTASLTITGVQAEDEADYYCAVWQSSSSHSDTSDGELRLKLCSAQ